MSTGGKREPVKRPAPWRSLTVMSEKRSDWQRELEELGHPYVPTEATQKRRDAEIARDADAKERDEWAADGRPKHGH